MIKEAPGQEEMVRYVYDQFCLSYDSPELSVAELKTLCLLDSEAEQILMTPSRWEPSESFLHKEYKVPVFFKENISEGLLIKGVIQMDVYLNAFLFLSGIQEWAFEDRDEHGRFLYKNSLQAKFNFVGTPVVNVYFELLAKAIQDQGHSCCYKKKAKQLIFTHDIDQVRSGWFDNLIYAFKEINLESPRLVVESIFTKLLGKQDPYYQGLLTMKQLDEQHELDGISFLMTKKSHKDADYDIRTILEPNVFGRQTIGLHPGYDTCKDEKELAKQFETLRRLFPSCKPIVRQHYLKYDVTATPRIHETLGIEQDYTLGFVEQYGFRNSYAGPFQLYCFEENRAYGVVEIPLYFMDSTLINYKKNASWEAKQEVILAVEKLLKNFNCTFSVLFHNSVFTENKYKGFSEMYEKLAEVSKEKT